jgi:hypothetical protein
VLSCSLGSWGPDLLGSFLYRAPQSFAYQWSRGGSDIAGAAASSFTADAPGDYRCRVTASNQAGSTAQTSDAHPVPSNAFSFGKLKLNKKKGTATQTVIVPGPGILTLSGSGVMKQRGARAARALALAKPVSAAGKVKLLIKAKGLAKSKLDRTGKVKVKVKVTFRPSSGAASSKKKTLKLIKTRH